MTTFCNCEVCLKIKKDIEKRTIFPKCSYCHKHHNPGLGCPEMIKKLGAGLSTRIPEKLY